MGAYKTIDADYIIHSPSVVLYDVVSGLNGTWHILGGIRLVQEDTLRVDARVRTTMALATDDFRPDIYATVSLTLSRPSGECILTRNLREAMMCSLVPSVWMKPGKSWEIWVGAVEVDLPQPPEALMLKIFGNLSYIYNEGTYAASILFTPEKTFSIGVEE